MSDQLVFVLSHALASAWGAGSVLASDHVLRNARRLFDIPLPVESNKDDGSCKHSSELLNFTWILTGALISLFLFSLFDNPLKAWFCLTVGSLCLVTALLDWQEHVVPDLFVVGLASLGLILWLVEDLSMLEHLLAALLSGIAMTGLMWLSAWRNLKRRPGVDDIAWGDVTLISGLGFLIGWQWLALFWMLIGPVHGILHVCTPKGRAAMKSGVPLPMAPALCIAGYVTLIGIHTGWLSNFLEN
jgi:prepilin signal peptidase PulO-like enzyme (type II secretory pathway)